MAAQGKPMFEALMEHHLKTIDGLGGRHEKIEDVETGAIPGMMIAGFFGPALREKRGNRREYARQEGQFSEYPYGNAKFTAPNSIGLDLYETGGRVIKGPKPDEIFSRLRELFIFRATHDPTVDSEAVEGLIGKMEQRSRKLMERLETLRGSTSIYRGERHEAFVQAMQDAFQLGRELGKRREFKGLAKLVGHDFPEPIDREFPTGRPGTSRGVFEQKVPVYEQPDRLQTRPLWLPEKKDWPKRGKIRKSRLLPR